MEAEHTVINKKEYDKLRGIEKLNMLRDMDGITDDASDILKYYKEFVNAGRLTEVSIDDNANTSDMSIISFYNEAPKALFKKAALDYITEKAGNKAYRAILEGYLYPNDLVKFFSPYCWAFDLTKLVDDGIDFIADLKIGKPKHASSYVDLVIQATAYISNNIAGAISYPNMLYYLDKFLVKDYGKDYTEREDVAKDIEQLFQKIVYSFNYPFRSQQSSFTNLSVFDKHFAEDLFGKEFDYDRFNKLQLWFCKYFIDMNKNIAPFTFPVITATFLEVNGDIQDKDFLKEISKLNIERGTFNIYAGELGKLCSCCRLVNDATVFTSALGTPSVSIGSSRVVALNMAAIAEKAGSIDNFFHVLKEYYDIAVDILMVHRQMLEEAIDKGKHPLYTKGWMTLSRQFCTVGFVGLYEGLQKLGYDIAELSGTEMAVTTIKHINTWNEQTSKQTGCMFNLEQIPAESAAITLAKKTNLVFNTDKYKILSNQYVPLTDNVSLDKRVYAQGKLDLLTQGGGILHINMDDKITSPEDMESLIKYIVSQGVKYFAVNYLVGVCSKCGETFVGNAKISKCCNAKVDSYIRVVGFLRPIKSFSSGRREEARNRQFYCEEETIGGKL